MVPSTPNDHPTIRSRSTPAVGDHREEDRGPPRPTAIRPIQLILSSPPRRSATLREDGGDQLSRREDGECPAGAEARSASNRCAREDRHPSTIGSSIRPHPAVLTVVGQEPST